MVGGREWQHWASSLYGRNPGWASWDNVLPALASVHVKHVNSQDVCALSTFVAGSSYSNMNLQKPLRCRRLRRLPLSVMQFESSEDWTFHARGASGLLPSASEASICSVNRAG